MLNKTLTFDVINRQLKKKGDHHSFLEYMKNYILDPPEKLEPNTIDRLLEFLSGLQSEAFSLEQFKTDYQYYSRDLLDLMDEGFKDYPPL